MKCAAGAGGSRQCLDPSGRTVWGLGSRSSSTSHRRPARAQDFFRTRTFFMVASVFLPLVMAGRCGPTSVRVLAPPMPRRPDRTGLGWVPVSPGCHDWSLRRSRPALRLATGYLQVAPQSPRVVGHLSLPDFAGNLCVVGLAVRAGRYSDSGSSSMARCPWQSGQRGIRPKAPSLLCVSAFHAASPLNRSLSSICRPRPANDGVGERGGVVAHLGPGGASCAIREFPHAALCDVLRSCSLRSGDPLTT